MVNELYQEFQYRFTELKNYDYRKEDYCLCYNNGPDEKYYVRYIGNELKTMRDVGIGEGAVLVAEFK